MKNIKYLIAGIILIITSCTTFKVDHYLEKVNYSGNVKTHSVKITDEEEQGKIKIRPYVVIARDETVSKNLGNHPPVNENGVYEVYKTDRKNEYSEVENRNKYEFEGNNFFWEKASVLTSLEVEYNLSRNFALYAGADYSKISGKELFGKWFGLGFMMENEKVGFRIDIGMDFREAYQDIIYYAKTERNEWFKSNEIHIYKYNPKGYFDSKNFNISATFNTKQLGFVDGFVTLGYDKQSFLNNEETYYAESRWETQKYDYYINRTHLVLGVFKDFGGNRILLGIDFIHNGFENSEQNRDSVWMKNLLIQYDIAF